MYSHLQNEQSMILINLRKVDLYFLINSIHLYQMTAYFSIIFSINYVYTFIVPFTLVPEDLQAVKSICAFENVARSDMIRSFLPTCALIVQFR